MKKTGIILVVAVTALCVSAITACTSTTLIAGKVLNWENEPVQRAFVMVKDKPSYSAMVNSNGEFSIPVDKGLSSAQIVISSPGCITFEGRVSPDSRIEVTLHSQDQILSQIEVGAAHALLKDLALVRMIKFRDYTKAQQQCVDL